MKAQLAFMLVILSMLSACKTSSSGSILQNDAQLAKTTASPHLCHAEGEYIGNQTEQEKELENLIQQLDSDFFATRERATKILTKKLLDQNQNGSVRAVLVYHMRSINVELSIEQKTRIQFVLDTCDQASVDILPHCPDNINRRSYEVQNQLPQQRFASLGHEIAAVIEGRFPNPQFVAGMKPNVFYSVSLQYFAPSPGKTCSQALEEARFQFGKIGSRDGDIFSPALKGLAIYSNCCQHRGLAYVNIPDVYRMTEVTETEITKRCSSSEIETFNAPPKTNDNWYDYFFFRYSADGKVQEVKACSAPPPPL